MRINALRHGQMVDFSFFFFFFQICVSCILSHDRWLEYSFHFDNSTDYLKASPCKIST